MSTRIAHITLTNTGPDPGPYNIYAIDGAGNATLAASNVPKSILTTVGYDITVDNTIETIEVFSINPDCEDGFLELQVPPAP
jgi:hypothetical protein